jgi:hypothetical protein
LETLERFRQNQRVIEDFTLHTLAAIPSGIGRLLHTATLRDLSTGRYFHEGLLEIYTEPAVHQALAYCHEELFAKVLETPLAQQIVDLRVCLSAFEGTFGDIAERWRELEFYRVLVPLGTPAYLRELFCSNLRVLLELLMRERANLASAA